MSSLQKQIQYNQKAIDIEKILKSIESNNFLKNEHF